VRHLKVANFLLLPPCKGGKRSWGAGMGVEVLIVFMPGFYPLPNGHGAFRRNRNRSQGLVRSPRNPLFTPRSPPDGTPDKTTQFWLRPKPSWIDHPLVKQLSIDQASNLSPAFRLVDLGGEGFASPPLRTLKPRPSGRGGAQKKIAKPLLLSQHTLKGTRAGKWLVIPKGEVCC